MSTRDGGTPDLKTPDWATADRVPPKDQRKASLRMAEAATRRDDLCPADQAADLAEVLAALELLPNDERT